MYLSNKKICQLLISLFILCLSQTTLAEEMTEGCRSCVKSYGCSRTNKICNATCQANLFSKKADLDSCRVDCIGKLERCLLSANKSCSFYCGEKK